MSASLEDPWLEPADHCYAVLQDHGPENGGWGPAAIAMPPLIPTPTLFVYTGDDPETLEVVRDLCGKLAKMTGKETRLVRFTAREDVAVFPGYR